MDVLEKEEGRVVANLGGPGQFPITEERILDRYGLKLEPEVVVWQFMTNDLGESAHYKYNNTAPPLKGVRAFFNAKSNVYVLAKRILNLFADTSERPVAFEIDGQLNVFNTPSSARETNAWCGTEVEEEVLRAIKRAEQKTEESGAKFVLLLVPMKEEIYIDRYNRNQNSSSDFSCPIKAVKAMAESNGIDYVDMTPVFMEASKTQNPYLSRGGHLSSYGNILVADALSLALDDV